MQELQNGTTLQGGKYRIEKMLGQGGFGITYKAVMKGSVTGSLGGMTVNIPVVLKEFFMDSVCLRVDGTRVSVPSTGSKEQTDRYRQKFIKEANNIASLSHPNIVQVMDVFEENGTVYYVMEYLEGGSLRQMMDKGALPEVQALEYVRQIGSALQYMHEEKHLCHLDVKPGNIMLTADGQAKLIDFGISKGYDKYGNETSSTPVGLSPGYAPLEQYQNALQDFSPVTDVYSLGATLLALLTGETPPEAAVVNEDGLGDRPSRISSHIWQAIESAMHPKRKDRPQYMKAFLEMLEEKETDDEKTVPTNGYSKEEKRGDAPVVSPVERTPPVQPPKRKEFLRYIIMALVIGIVALGLGVHELVKSNNLTPKPSKWKETSQFSEGLAWVKDTNDKYGFIDKTGLVVIPCQWNSAAIFQEGLAWVKDTNDKYGFIDKTGKIVIPCKWNEAGYFHEGLAYIQDANGKYGFIDKTGKVISPCKWKHAENFHEGLACVEDANGKYGFIDKTGKVVIPCNWKDADNNDIYGGLIQVQDANGRWGYINRAGEVIVPCKSLNKKY